MTNTKVKQMYDPLRIQGCGPIALFTIFSVWVIVISAVDIFTNWTLEQSLFEISTGIPDIRWINHAVLMGLILISTVIAFFTVKSPRLKLAFRLWMIGAVVSLLMAPAKLLFVTDEQAIAVIQIMDLLLSGVVLFWIGRPKKLLPKENQNKGSFIGLTILIAAGIFVPWVLWGALGSIVDTLLYLILGLVFGLFTVQTLYPFLFDQTLETSREVKLGDFILDGFISALFFLILMSGIGQNGSQLLLITFFPASGWLITAVAMTGRNLRNREKISVGLLGGLLVALPLMWFDADELSMLVNGAPGETVQWATRAAWTTLGVIMFIAIIFAINFKYRNHFQLDKKVNLIFSLVSFGVVVVLYVSMGRPGFFGDQIFVVMKNQADLTQVGKISDLSQRRQEVYTTLVNTAEDSQKSIQQQLSAWHLSYTPYYLVDGLEVNAGPIYTMLLAKRSDVDRILPSPHLRPLPQKPPLINNDPVSQPEEPTWNLKMIGVDQVWQKFGDKGKGILIGETDTGVDGYHPELASSYRGASTSDDYNWLDPWNHSPFPTDVEGHGTATLALITGKNIGIAPEAQWIGCVNLARDLGNPAVYLNCMQFMLAPYPQNGNAFTDGVPAKGAMIVNNSWGCPEVEGCDAKIYLPTVQAMETAGIFMSVAAGNTGSYGCGTITDPLAIYNDVFTVGSINQEGNVSSFSSLGPVVVDGSDRVKPDLLAPGEGIVSAFPKDAYTKGDGTSFAAPHVSGVVALMWSANPKLIGNILLTKQILEQTASPYAGTLPACVTNTQTPNDASGYGVLNAYAAVKAALAVK